MEKTKCMEEKKEGADDITQWNIPVESGFEIDIPEIVLDKLGVGEGDSIKFVEDNERIILEKA